jgi:cytochrome c oxidase cbb3-type subunit I/II
MRRFVLLSFVFFLILALIPLVGELLRTQKGLVHAQQDLKLGKSIYRENCLACHGERGDGKGPQAEKLKTKPRDFTTGIYKFRLTPSGSLPLDSDLVRTVTKGVRGTSMLAQLHLSQKETQAVVQYLKSFSSRFNKEKPVKAIAIPPKPSATSHLISLGKSRYQEAGCAQCHGANGKGDGPSGRDLKDDWGQSISPADLTLKPFKSGPEPEDLYRTITTGLNGTPMPSYANVLTSQERWGLVFYITSIATKERPREMMGLVGEEVEGMRIDMRAAMAGMKGGGGMMRKNRGMMDRNMKDMMGR